MSERITPEINRTLSSGSGDWAGDFIWDAAGPSSGYGSLLVTLGPYPDTKHVSLSYPSISPKPNRGNLFRLSVCKITYEVFILSFLITDGLYSAAASWNPPSGPGFWDRAAFTFGIPAAWNLSSTLLTISLTTSFGLGWGSIIALAYFSLLPEPIKPQNLPVMGIG